MKNSRAQGSATAVIIVILVIVLIGVLGFTGWNNFLAPKEAALQESLITKSQAVSDKKLAVENQDEDYLLLEDWGVKFKLPDNIGKVHYYKMQVKNENGTFEHYEFSTARVEALGEKCVESNGEGSATRLASLSRAVEDQVSNPHRGIFVNNNQPLGGYYYYMGGAQSMCATKGENIQGNDRNLLMEMLKNPIVS